MDPEKQDKGFNPGDSHYNDDFFAGRKTSDSSTGLAELENNATEDQSDQNQEDNLSNVRGKEQNSQWDNNVSKASSQLEKTGGTKGKFAAKALRAANNNFGPIGAILVAGTLLIIGATGTGLIMPMQLTEIFTAEFSDSSAATQVRSERMLAKKIDRDMDVGAICKTTTLRCKYNTLSDKQIKKYQAAGFEVETKGKSISGRNKISSISLEVNDGFDNNGVPQSKKVTATNAREFNQLRRSNTDFRKTSTSVYNSRTHTYFSKKFTSVLGKLNLNRASKFDGKQSKEDNLKKLNKEINAKENAGIRDDRGRLVDEEGTRTAHESDFMGLKTDADDIENKSRDSIENNRDTVNNPEAPDTNPADSTVDSNGAVRKFGQGTVMATGGACAMYDIPRMVSAGIKTVKMGKLMAYSLAILSEVHKVKAGKDTDGSSLRFVGEILSSGFANRPNVSNSSSMQLALTGISPGITPGSESFSLSSGGVVGALDDYNAMTSDLVSKIGGVAAFFNLGQISGIKDPNAQGQLTVRSLCLASEAADIALLAGSIFTGGTTLIVKGIKVAIELAIDVVVGYLAGKAIEEIVTRASSMPLNADTTDGNAADAVFAGRAFIDNHKSAAYGLGPSTLGGIEEYTAFKNQVSTHNIAMDIEDAKDTPFDIYNQYSFIGMAVRNLNLNLGMSSSLTSRTAGLLSLVPSALSTAIMPSANAAYTQPHAEFNPNRYLESNDPAAASVGAAPDVFGNVRYSMSPRERNLDAEKVLNFMIENQYIDETTGEPLDNTQGRRFEKYQKYCADRTDPIGENSYGNGSIFDLNLIMSLATDAQEAMLELLWQTGQACVSGQPVTSDDRDTWVSHVDESYLVAEEWRDTALLTGQPGAKVAATEDLVAAAGDPGQVELEMFRVFTMDMALLDDIDGEIGQGGGESGSSGGTGANGTVNPDGWAYPTTPEGMITSGFGIRDGEPHQGVDIAQPGDATGNPIFAAREGKVLASGPADGFGNWIVIQHDVDGQQIDTVYGHMYSDGLLVSTGDTVTAGQELGKIGNAGASSGPHLHFEIWPGGRLNGGSAIDPQPIIGGGS